jgi:hypothetical protein
MIALCYSHPALRSRSAICINLRPPGKNLSVARLIIGAHEYGWLNSGSRLPALEQRIGGEWPLEYALRALDLCMVLCCDTIFM